MRLSDIMGNAGLSVYAQVALVIFILVFLAIIVRTWAPSRQEELREISMIPLKDEPTAPPTDAPSAPLTKEPAAPQTDATPKNGEHTL